MAAKLIYQRFLLFKQEAFSVFRYIMQKNFILSLIYYKAKQLKLKAIK